MRRETNFIMSEKELHSYRLSSLEDPTDEMLEALMEQVGEAARQSNAAAKEIVRQRIAAIKENFPA